jgi:hypothetical protein
VLRDPFVLGEQLCFSACDGDLGHDVVTSALIGVMRPSKELAESYAKMRS